MSTNLEPIIAEMAKLIEDSQYESKLSKTPFVDLLRKAYEAGKRDGAKESS